MLADNAPRLSRYAPWRSRPPSPKQLQLFLKMKGVDGAEGDTTVSVLGKQVPLAKLKAGQVRHRPGYGVEDGTRY